jgi:hypothetical protein
MLKVIPSKYANIIFRSRTEAKWAVFFQALGLRWTYEAEGYRLPNGARYLPDFELQLSNGEVVICEVKPNDVDEPCELGHLRRLVREKGCAAVLLSGEPRCRAFYSWRPGNPCHELVFFESDEPHLTWNAKAWEKCLVENKNTGAQVFNRELNDNEMKKMFGERYVAALTRALSYKFDKGEQHLWNQMTLWKRTTTKI